MLYLQVFSKKSFAESQADFNAWMQEHKGCALVNIGFHQVAGQSEICVLWTDAPQDNRIAVPDLRITGRPQ